MKRKFYSLLLFLGCLVILTPIISSASEEQNYIALFEREVDVAIVEASGATIEKTIKNSPIALLKADEEAFLKLQQLKEIKSINKNETIEIASQRVSWGVKPTKIESAWRSGYTGKGVKIGVIDSGIGPHDDLAVVENISFLEWDESPEDRNGHGTHVAGIIGALDNDLGVKGVAPDALLYGLKVFDKDGNGSIYNVINAVDWAIENDMDIINMSLTSSVGLPAYKEIISRAYESGIVIVAAAGNAPTIRNPKDNVEFPAKYEEVIAVSSIDDQNNKGYYSAVGPAVEIAAPGVHIYSTYLNNSYSILSGTSLATAFVTGNIALLKEAYPSLTNVQIRKKIVDDALDLGPKGRDPVFGYGLLQSSTYEKPLYEFPAEKNAVTQLSLSTNQITAESGETLNLKVTAKFTNGITQDVSEFAQWKSGDHSIATTRGSRIDFHDVGQTSLLVSYGDLHVEVPTEVREKTTQSATKKIPFTDLSKKHWAQEAIVEIYSKKIINGYADKTFKPTESIQRQHVASMITRTLTLDKKVPFAPFSDVSMSSPYFYDIMKTQQANIFSGSEEGFDPFGELTRAQMAKVLVNAFDLPKSTSHPFSDVQKKHWANEYIAALYQSGITTGTDGQFKPNRPVSRAEFTVFIQRALAR